MSYIKRFVEDVAEPVAEALDIDWGAAFELVNEHLVMEELNPYSPDMADMIHDAAMMVVRNSGLPLSARAA